MIRVRPEEETEYCAVRALHIGAFSTPAEANLVERLRQDESAVISLVAAEGGEVVGHAMFSEMSAPFRALGLAPVSVHSERRKQGIASKLIEEGTRLAAAGSWEAVFVLGEPSFYRRFGFSTEAAQGFESPYSGPYLMVRPLLPSGLPARSGRIEYAPAFSRL